MEILVSDLWPTEGQMGERQPTELRAWWTNWEVHMRPTWIFPKLVERDLRASGIPAILWVEIGS